MNNTREGLLHLVFKFERKCLDNENYNDAELLDRISKMDNVTLLNVLAKWINKEADSLFSDLDEGDKK